MPWPAPSLRMQRYAAQANKGKVKASPELIKMWGTESGRSMAAMETYVHIIDMLKNKYQGFYMCQMFMISPIN